MSKLIQRGASAAMRMRSMSTAPEKLTEMGLKINPAQSAFGPKSTHVEKWQQHYQAPINAEKPMYRRKGVSDDLVVVSVSIVISALFVQNVYKFFTL